MGRQAGSAIGPCPGHDPDIAAACAGAESGSPRWTTGRCIRVLAALLTLLLSGCAGERSCALVPLADIPLDPVNGLLLVRAGIDGRWVTLLVDTGAERTVLTEQAVARLGLGHDSHNTRSVGIGGFSTNLDARVNGIVLGGTRFPVERVAVGSFSIQDGPGTQVDGLLGADILLAFETDIDIPDRRLTLYRVRRCPDVAPPWPAVEVPGIGARRDRMLVPIALDGATGMAVLDTGAQATSVTAELASRAGVTPAELAADPKVMVHGAAPRPVPAPWHRFHELRIGPDRIRDPRIVVVPDSDGLGDGLIGENFIRGRRLWLAFPTRRLFLASPRPPAHRVGSEFRPAIVAVSPR